MPTFQSPDRPAGFEQNALANVETGVLMLCKEMLVTAINDRRLARKHLMVLAAFVQVMNLTTAHAWPSRETIARLTGYTEKTVSNIISELRTFGYLISDRRPVAEAGGRTLMTYTFGNVDHETIRRVITETVEQMQAKRAGQVPRGQGSEFPVGREQSSPPAGKFPVGREASSPPAGNIEFPASGEDGGTKGESSPPVGKGVPRPRGADTEDSIEGESRGSSGESVDGATARESDSRIASPAMPTAIAPPGDKKPKRPAAERGTRLPSEWVLSRTLGDWVMEHYDVPADMIRQEAARFRDYWIAQPGSKGLKTDWSATWRNWVRSSAQRGKWRAIKFDTEAAPDLFDRPRAEVVDENAVYFEQIRQENLRARAEADG